MTRLILALLFCSQLSGCFLLILPCYDDPVCKAAQEAVPVRQAVIDAGKAK